MTKSKRAAPIAVDVHAHLIPATVARVGELAGIEWDSGTQAITIDGHVPGPASLAQPSKLLAWMDLNQVRHAWISIPPPAYRPQLNEKASRDWVRYVNDGLEAIAVASEGRLSALFHLPVEHPVLAADIATAGSRKFSMSAGAGPTVRLSDAIYEPLWSALDAHAAFLFVHPGTTCDPRMDRYFLRNLVGNPVETGIAASHLLLAGVLERYQSLTICLAHGGGIFPAVADRIDHGHAAGAIKDAELQNRPAKIVRRFCADCITHGPSGLSLAAKAFGKDRLYFGSDWPFPMGLLDPHMQLAWLSSIDRQRIFETNGVDLLACFDGRKTADVREEY